jgi:hypothetical protein
MPTTTPSRLAHPRAAQHLLNRLGRANRLRLGSDLVLRQADARVQAPAHFEAAVGWRLLLTALHAVFLSEHWSPIARGRNRTFAPCRMSDDGNAGEYVPPQARLLPKWADPSCYRRYRSGRHASQGRRGHVWRTGLGDTRNRFRPVRQPCLAPALLC